MLILVSDMSHDHFFFWLCCLAHGILVEPLPLHWKQCSNHWTSKVVHDHFLFYLFINVLPLLEKVFFCFQNPHLFSILSSINPSRNLFSIWESDCPVQHLSRVFSVYEFFLSCHMEMELDKPVFHINVVFAFHPFALWTAHTGSLMFPWKRKLMGNY